MFPRLFTLPIPDFLQGFLPAHIILHSYGLMIALGIVAAFYIVLKKAKKFGLDADTVSSLFIWVILAAFVGGKLFFFMEDLGKYTANPSLIKGAMGGGFVFYGSLIFAIPTIVIWLRRKKVPVRPFLDSSICWTCSAFFWESRMLFSRMLPRPSMRQLDGSKFQPSKYTSSY